MDSTRTRFAVEQHQISAVYREIPGNQGQVTVSLICSTINAMLVHETSMASGLAVTETLRSKRAGH
jgi:hypothetical protein